MTLARQLSSAPRIVALAYLACFVGLDWISFVNPYGPFGITPWNPATGLNFILILLLGPRYLPLLFLAPFLADQVERASSVSALVSAAVATVFGTGYSIASLVLLRTDYARRLAPKTMRDLWILFAIAVVSSGCVAIGAVVVYALAGLLPWSDFARATARYWVGDLIGIAVVTPFVLVMLSREGPRRLGWEGLMQMAAICLALVLVFAVGQNRQFQFFYILFLPIVWIAVRSGFEAVTVALVLLQIGLMAMVQLIPPPTADITSLQALLLVLSLTGLAAGMLVTERRQAELQLRLQQDVQARLRQLGSMGELTSLVAHEVNQPLMAAGTYTRFAAEAIASIPAAAKAHEAALKAVRQVERASEVVRRLRDLVRLGRSQRDAVSVERIVAETLDLLAPDLERRSDVRIVTDIPTDLPPVRVDIVQVEQVLLNLVRNALESLHTTARAGGVVSIEATRIDEEFVRLSIHDNGPGFSFDPTADQRPFSSTKPEGLGIGLALSRTIVEAHGARLEIAKPTRGALVRFSLPVATEGP